MKSHFLFTLTMILCATMMAQDIKLTPDDLSMGDVFGAVVAIYGDYAVISSIYDDDNGEDSGSAYVFKKTDDIWTLQTKIMPSDGAAGDWCFASALYGDYLIMCAPHDDDNGENSGSAYIFKRTGESWEQQAKLLPDDGAAGDFFGHYSSIYGDYVIIGAELDDDNGDKSGSAYIFKRTGETWTQQAKLTPDDGAADDHFGNNAVIYGDYAVINSFGDDDNGENSGSAYVFKRTGDTWTQQAKLKPDDGAEGDFFAGFLAIDGDYIVLGAPFDNDNGENSGSAYVFQRTGETWEQQAKLLASDGTAGDRFGYRVAIYEDYVVVGAELDGENGMNSGSAYIFQRIGENWEQQAKLTAYDGAVDDRFGHHVAIYEDDVLIGSPYAGVSGAAYVFDIDLISPAKAIFIESDEINIYPNPARNAVVVEHTNGIKLERVVLYDQQGRMLHQKQLKNNVLDVSSYPAGIYYLEVEIGNKRAIKKLIVE